MAATEDEWAWLADGLRVASTVADVIEQLARSMRRPNVLMVTTPTTGRPAMQSMVDEPGWNVRHVGYAAPEQRRALELSSEWMALCELEQSRHSIAPADIVFLDPWHTYDDSCRVIDVGVELVAPGGWLVVHDVWPRHPALMGGVPADPRTAWCGDTWRAFADAAASFDEAWRWCVVDIDFGIGVVRPPDPRGAWAPLGMAHYAARLGSATDTRHVVRHLLRCGSDADESRDGGSPGREDGAVNEGNTTSSLVRELTAAVLADPGVDTSRPVSIGHCPVCGQWGTFAVNAAPLRENLLCAGCCSTSRYRRMALGVLRAIGDITGVEAGSLQELPSEHSMSVRVLDTQPPFDARPYARYWGPAILAEKPWIEVHTSSYDPALPWGTSLGGTTTNQNLEQLTFADGYFDVLLTSDVLEHVRLYERAHAEIARVVRSGGVYLFTVPHGRGIHEHLERVRVHDPLDPVRDEFVLPPEYHGSASPDEGPVLSYRVFGTRIDDELRDVGFEVEYTIEPAFEHGVFETELFYCRRR